MEVTLPKGKETNSQPIQFLKKEKDLPPSPSSFFILRKKFPAIDGTEGR